jgi:hypothetical protein
MLCRDLIKYSEVELRSRSETSVLKENHLLHLLYMKDKQIENLESRIQNAKKNMDKIVSAYLYENGNKIIYELDVAKRQLRTFKDNIYKMEQDLREKISSEYQNTIRRNVIQINSTKRSFNDFKTDISTKIKSDILQEQNYIEKEIKRKGFEYQQVDMKALKKAVIFAEDTAKKIDSQYDPEKYWEAIDKAKESQSNAIKELAELSEMSRKNEDNLKVENVKIREKMQEKINLLNRQLTDNKSLWQHLAEAEKRESILKQELIFTQQ